MANSWRDGIFKWWERYGGIAAFGIPLALYLVVGSRLAAAQKENLHADAVCYVRRAMYLAQGDFYHAISGHWSPLISWCAAPLVYCGMDGLYAVRLVVWAWGGLLILAFGYLLRSLECFSNAWRLAATTVVSLVMCTVVGGQLTPDVLLAASLIGYLAVLSSARLMERRWLQLAGGVLGAVAYLGKAYAFPFVLVHLPMTFALRGWGLWRSGTCGGGRALREALGGYAMAMLAFGALAGPWVGVLSWRYGHLTFATVGTAAHAVMAPEQSPTFARFVVPEDPYIAPWENPETVILSNWNPVESRKNLGHQLSVMRGNAAVLVEIFRGFGPGYVGLIGMGLTPLVLPLMRQRERGLVLWLWVSILLYCSGFLFVWLTGRYIVPFVLPLDLVLGLVLVWGLFSASAGASGGSPSRVGFWVRTGLGVIFVALFAVSPVRDVYRLSQARPFAATYRRLAAEIKKAGLQGSFASPDMPRGCFIALFSGLKYVGFPEDESVEDIDRTLRDHKIGMVLLWGRPPRNDPNGKAVRAGELVERPGWRRVYSNGGVGIYVPDVAADQRR